MSGNPKEIMDKSLASRWMGRVATWQPRDNGQLSEADRKRRGPGTFADSESDDGVPTDVCCESLCDVLPVESGGLMETAECLCGSDTAGGDLNRYPRRGCSSRASIAEEELSMTDFAFNDAPNTAAFVCRHVWADAEPIVLVCHECD